MEIIMRAIRGYHWRAHTTWLNPLLPSVPYMAPLAKISIYISKEIIKKISYERCDYESVDEESLS